MRAVSNEGFVKLSDLAREVVLFASSGEAARLDGEGVGGSGGDRVGRRVNVGARDQHTVAVRGRARSAAAHASSHRLKCQTVKTSNTRVIDLRSVRILP